MDVEFTVDLSYTSSSGSRQGVTRRWARVAVTAQVCAWAIVGGVDSTSGSRFDKFN